MIEAQLSTGGNVPLIVPKGMTLDVVQKTLLDGSIWPETIGGWFVNPAHIVAIREVEDE